MSAGATARSLHRWVSVAFTVTASANFVAMALRPGQPPGWVTFSPLLLLFVLLGTGLYLFALPYAARPRTPSAG